MYANCTSGSGRARLVAGALAAIVALSGRQLTALAQMPATQNVVLNVSRATERLEMTVNTSTILTLDTRIPRLVVNNPELVTATPISETQIQIAARKPGVTQINLWDENGQIYTVDLLIFGDVRELELVLKQMFPQSTIKVTRLTNSLVLNGQVDRPEMVSTVFRLAEDYAPKIVSNLAVGGVQQVILKVKVMEVSRSKLRELGVDFSVLGPDGSFASGVSGTLNTPAGLAPTTVQFGIFDSGTNFNAFINALEENRLSKTLADPTLVTVSGRPARFQVGGQIPIPVPQTGSAGQGTTITIEYKDFGTVIDFVPIVLGNGRIRLEVRPELSDLDFANAVTLNGFVIPAIKKQLVDTGVEMNAGQTLALAGLIQEKITAQNRGIPYIKDLPIIGVPFRRVREQVDEIESLVIVTPDFVDAMDPHEVPQCGPGMETMSPSDCELYWRGHVEVPACGPCGASDPCRCPAPGLRCENGECYGGAGMPMGASAMATDGYPPGSVQMYGPEGLEPLMPTPAGPATGPMLNRSAPNGATMPDPAASWMQPQWQQTAVTNRQIQPRSHAAARVAGPATSTPGLIGPIGYDVQK